MESKHWYVVTENHEYDWKATTVVARVLATESEIENFEWEPNQELYGRDDVFYTFRRVKDYRNIDSMKRAFIEAEREEQLREERWEEERERMERETPPEPPIPEGFVRVRVGTTLQRESIDVDPKTKIEDIFEMCNVDFSGYCTSLGALNGVPLNGHRGDYQRTLADYGIMSGRCTLTAVKISKNV